MNSTYLGVDLGGTNLRCAVVDEENQVLSRVESPTHAHEGPEAVIDRLVAGMIKAASTAGLDLGEIRAAGIGYPGPLNQVTGTVYSAPNMPGWKNVPLADTIATKTGVTTFIENDANCAGWGEFVAGAGVGSGHMMMVTLGTGVGGAIIVDGKLHVGRDGSAGELGHVCIIDGGRQCGCGARGCVEAYASATAVVKRFTEYLDRGWVSQLAQRRETLTCQAIFEAALTGDAVAMKIVQETGHYLGIMASAVAELLNPEICVIAGGMMQAGDMLLESIRTTCLDRNDHPGRTMRIVPAKLGGNAGLIGAASHAKHSASPAHHGIRTVCGI
ncbi:MAG: ROK family protein [Planctomycetaceae bacterium]|nr:ROK family protein [Planctomycetaceae bacterium]